MLLCKRTGIQLTLILYSISIPRRVFIAPRTCGDCGCDLSLMRSFRLDTVTSIKVNAPSKAWKADESLAKIIAVITSVNNIQL